MGRHSGPAVNTAAQRVRMQGDSKNVRAWPNRPAIVSVATASPAIPRAGPTEPCLGGWALGMVCWGERWLPQCGGGMGGAKLSQWVGGASEGERDDAQVGTR